LLKKNNYELINDLSIGDKMENDISNLINKFDKIQNNFNGNDI